MKPLLAQDRHLYLRGHIPPVPDDKAPPSAIRAMIVILTVMALLAVYAHMQKSRRDKLETVIVTPVATPSPSPSVP